MGNLKRGLYTILILIITCLIILNVRLGFNTMHGDNTPLHCSKTSLGIDTDLYLKFKNNKTVYIKEVYTVHNVTTKSLDALKNSVEGTKYNGCETHLILEGTTAITSMECDLTVISDEDFDTVFGNDKKLITNFNRNDWIRSDNNFTCK